MERCCRTYECTEIDLQVYELKEKQRRAFKFIKDQV